MSDTIAVMKIELCDPTNKENDPHWFGLRITEYDTDSPDKERITNVVERAYWWHTPLIEAIEDLVTFTQCSIRHEESEIIREVLDNGSL